MSCEDCKYVLIHYDKKGNKTVRCYYTYLKSLSNVTKFEHHKDVTDRKSVCQNYEFDEKPVEHRTYKAKEIKHETDA